MIKEENKVNKLPQKLYSWNNERRNHGSSILLVKEAIKSYCSDMPRTDLSCVHHRMYTTREMAVTTRLIVSRSPQKAETGRNGGRHACMHARTAEWRVVASRGRYLDSRRVHTCVRIQYHFPPTNLQTYLTYHRTFYPSRGLLSSLASSVRW